jgi:hypothetical protein
MSDLRGFTMAGGAARAIAAQTYAGVPLSPLDPDARSRELDYELEAAYSDALEAVASGVAYDETLSHVLVHYPHAPQAELKLQLRDAYRDARRQGVELEDIDASWKEGNN